MSSTRPPAIFGVELKNRQDDEHSDLAVYEYQDRIDAFTSNNCDGEVWKALIGLLASERKRAGRRA